MGKMNIMKYDLRQSRIANGEMDMDMTNVGLKTEDEHWEMKSVNAQMGDAATTTGNLGS